MKPLFEMLAGYNAWANERIYDAASSSISARLALAWSAARLSPAAGPQRRAAG